MCQDKYEMCPRCNKWMSARLFDAHVLAEAKAVQEAVLRAAETRAKEQHG